MAALASVDVPADAQQGASSTRAASRQATSQVAFPTLPATAESSVGGGASPAKAAKFRGRLPAYFAKVVDDQQRRKIYGIQEEYHERIEALKAQLAAMMEERDQMIEAILTPDQRQQIDRMKSAAKTKRQDGEEEK
ncbi:MAG: hypothetical protein HUU20_11060 [Pirellulales bacterium]|nr:hypothetical protein [Pirellulales bacterium]